MSDVLLVNPKSIDILPSYLPYGLLYLASFLRTKKVSVVIFDSNTMTEDFLDFIKACRPKLVGLSILSGPCLADAVDKARLVRKHFPKTRIVFGGIHTTIFPREVLQNDYVDFIIQGEGEEPLLELTEFILKGKGFLAKIKNLGYKEGKRLKLNPLRPFIDLNQLPLPAWDLVPIEKYLHQKFYASRVLTLHTSRGCPWDCAYCYNRLVNFRRWRAISAEKIIAQIEYLISHYQVNGIQFYDDEFDVDEERVKRFCRLLLEKKIKIKWSHYSRTNIADESRYCLEKEAGCAFIEFGVESGSPRLLKMLRKDQTIRQIKRAFLICRKIGLSAGAMFMIGLPTETERELLMTQKLINFLSAYQTLSLIHI